MVDSVTLLSKCSQFITFCEHFIALFSSHLIAASSAEWSCSKQSSASFVSGQASTVWRIVCISPHGHLSDVARCHLWRFAAHCPCPVWKRFNLDHDRRGRSKPCCQIVGLVTNEWLTTDTDFQTSLHCVTTLVGTISDQISFRCASRRGGWLTKSLCIQ